MGESDSFVSVVTPFYNTDQYLEQCIESVLAQTHGNFEYILVDNHSTDQGGNIAARYAARDGRIRVLRPEKFLSQCDNFNFALRQISPSSRYTKMVLADDWLFPQCLKEMVQLADAHPSIGVVSSYWVAETQPGGFGLPVDQTFVKGRDAARAHLLGGIFPFGNNSTVMYRSDLVRARPDFYEESRVFFDTDAVFRILKEHDFGFVHQVLSFYRDHPGSITDKTRDFSPYVIDRLIILKNYGRDFLTAEEYEECLAPVQRHFYHGLGQQWLRELLKPKREDYWNYQRRGLAAAGAHIEWSRVGLGAGAALLKTVSSPLEVARSLRSARRRPRTH